MPAIVTRLRNHIITGFIFIMPVLISLAVLMKFWTHLLNIGGRVSRLLRVDTVLGPSGDAVMAVLVFLLICIVAGFLIRISFLRRISERIDEKLNEMVPGYSQIRSEATKKIGARDEELLFDACLVKVLDLWQPGYIVEQNDDGTQTVFVPQAPAFTAGQVYVVDPGRIKRLDIDSTTLNEHLKRLGRGIASRSASPGQRRV